MGEESLEITAKLKLDTAEAEQKLSKVQGDAAKTKVPSEAKEAIDGVGKKLKGLGAILRGASAGVGGLARGISSALSDVSATAAGAVAAIAGVIAIVGKLLQGTDTLKQVSNAFSSVMTKLREVLGPVTSLLGDIMAAGYDIVKDLLPVLEPAVIGLSFALSTVLEVIKPLEAVIKGLSVTFKFLFERIKEVFSFIGVNLAVSGTTTGQQANFKSSLDTWETSGSDITAGEEATINSIDDLKAFWKDTFGNIWERLKEKVVTPLLAPFDTLRARFDELKTALEPVRNIASTVGTVVGTVFKSGINTYVIGPLNVVLSAIKNATFLGAKPFDFINLIPTFAKGGTVGAQIWGMNEIGNPEFMFNAGGSSSVINADILESAMYSAVSDALSSRPTRIEVSVKDGTAAGPRELVQYLLPTLKFALKS